MQTELVNRDRVALGLMGLGVVGGGIAKVLAEKGDFLLREIGCPLSLKKILVRDPSKERSVSVDPGLVTTQANEILDDPEIDILVEVMGGEHPAFDYMKRAIKSGKHVVTANKEVIAKHGPELLDLAYAHGVDIAYEASVGGGIPLISPFKRGLVANDVIAIHAIINGTTNYILSRMSKEDIEFGAALKQAQKLGYAEADPTNDVDGLDAAYKLAILATIAFRTKVEAKDVYREGITRLAARDFKYAKELGYAIKLLGIARKHEGSVEVRVHPAFIPQDLMLAKVDGVFNAVLVEGDLVGPVLFYGRGAGELPTSSSVIADIIDVSRNLRAGVNNRARLHFGVPCSIKPMAEIETRYYLRMSVADRPGVLAKIAAVLGKHFISIASVLQKETDISAQSAELVIITHPAREMAIQDALREVQRLRVVRKIGNFVRIES